MLDKMQSSEADVDINPWLMNRQGRDECLRALRQEYKELDEEEARLLERLASLKLDKRAVRIKQGTFAPVYMLSDDLLARIIEKTCMHDYDRCFNDFWCNRGWQEEPPLSPRTICNISRRFRGLAQALPRIWQCIHIDNIDNPHRYPAQLYLRWSQDLPLFIILDYVMPSEDTDSCSSSDSETDLVGIRLELLWDEWRAVLEETHRWKYLSIPVGVLGQEDGIPESNLQGMKMPLLNMYFLRTLSSLTSGHGQHLACLSNLAILMLHRPRSDREYTYINREVWCGILKSAPNLETIVADSAFVSHIAKPADVPLGTIQLSKLRYASFRSMHGRLWSSSNAPQNLLPYISTPALHTVHLTDVEIERLQHQFLGLQFLHVKHLRMRHTSCRSQDDFKWLLHQLHELTSLSIFDFYRYHASEDAVAALSDESVLPCLETLAIAPTLSLPELEEYVQARIIANHPLKKLRIDNRSSPRSEIDAAFGGSLVLEYFDYKAEEEKMKKLAYNTS